MKRRHIVVLIALLGVVGFYSCEKIKGKGDVVTESRAITGYTDIELSFDATVYYTQGAEYSLLIEAQENLMPYIQARVNNEKLVLREKPGVVLVKHEPIIFRITAPSVSDIGISGSGNLYVLSTWTGDNLEADISGSGKIIVTAVDSRSLNVDISGSGEMTISGGFTDFQDIDISGSGKADLRQVSSVNTTADISGSGDIYVQVSDLLDATISGSGSIYYLGQPVVNTHISGSGKVIRL